MTTELIPALSATSTETRVAIGLDIGGTKISAARLNTTKGIERFEKVSTPTDGRAFVAAIVELLKPLMDGDAVPECIGIASAGTVNSDTGEIFGSTGNLPALRQIGSLRESLEQQLNVPVFVENDANAAAYGEARAGAAVGYADVLMITLGTGVGTGFLIHDQLVRGAHFTGGEGGHIAISKSKRRLCTCGRWDCWETYASGTGLAKTAQLELVAAPNAQSSLILQKNGKAIPDVTTYDVLAAYEAGDYIAKEVLSQWHQDIALGLGSLMNFLDPAITVVGGGMASVVDFELLTRLTQERAMHAPIQLVPATLGNKAGIVGAAYLALDRVKASA
jgi:glucokinase